MTDSTVTNANTKSKVLNDVWCVWYRYDLNSWSKDGFRKLCTLRTVDDIWTFEHFCREKENRKLLTEYIVIMKEGIDPIWEHPRNRDGGCWSIKIDVQKSLQLFIEYLCLIVTDDAVLQTGITNGISISSKNTFNTIIQLWSSDKKYNTIDCLTPMIRDSNGYEIIYRTHNPEY